MQMKNSKYIKISASVFTLLFVLWIATPKVFINNLSQLNISNFLNTSEANIESQSQETNDFDGESKPVYFNIFKFVNSFIPVKHQN